MKTESNDVSTVNHPPHYNRFSHEVIELVEKMSFCNGNALKYLLRAPFKGAFSEDLKKAAWYLRRCETFPLTMQQEQLLKGFALEMAEHSPELSSVLRWLLEGIYPHSIADDLEELLRRQDGTEAEA